MTPLIARSCCFSGCLICLFAFSFLIDSDLGAESSDNGSIIIPDSLSEKIHDLQSKGRFEEALSIARDLHRIIKADSLAKTWRIKNSEQEIENLEYLLDLPDSLKEDVIKAYKMNEEISRRWDAGEYATAAEVSKRQLEIRQRIYTGDHPEIAHSMRDIGACFHDQAEYDKAEDYSQQALEMRLRIFTRIHPDVAESLNNLGRIYLKTADYKKAEEFLSEALETYRMCYGDVHIKVASALNNLGLVYSNQGQYDKCIPMNCEAVLIYRNLVGEESKDTATLMSNLAILLIQMGDYAAADPILRKAVSIHRRLLGGEHPSVAQTIEVLGMLCYYKGDIEEAGDHYQEALEIRKKSLGDDHPRTLSNLNNLATVRFRNSDFVNAERLCREVLAKQRPLLGSDHPDVSIVTQNLAVCLKEQGKLAEAEALFLGEYKSKMQREDTDQISIAHILYNMGCTHWEQNEFAEAETCFRKGLEIERRYLGEEHPSVSQDLDMLAGCSIVAGDLCEAEKLLTQSADIFDAARLRTGLGSARATFRKSPYSRLAAIRLLLGDETGAWLAMERALGRVLVDILAVSGQRSLTNEELAVEDSLKHRLDRLEDELGSLQSASAHDTPNSTSSVFEQTRNRLLEIEAQWSLFQHDMAEKYPVTEGQVYPLERVQSMMGKNEALIGWLYEEFKTIGNKGWGYIIRSDGPVQWISLKTSVADNEVPIKETLSQFRESLEMAGSWPFRVTAVDRVISEAQGLYHATLAPLETHLKDVTVLTIIPSGLMLGVPIEALIDSDEVGFGERFAISYVPSATIATWLREQPDRSYQEMTALLLGDPPFSPQDLAAMEGDGEQVGELSSNVRNVDQEIEPITDYYPRLQKTRDEVTSVASLLSNAMVFLGPDASEQKIDQLNEAGVLNQFSIIHLATHTFVDDKRPERSALILSQVQLPDPLEATMSGQPINDGVLTVKEIIRQWDLNADLVTLSGCQTALGRKTGEGYIGLAHAFLQTGARSLLVSLWKVEDEATALLMKRFYENFTGVYEDDRGQGDSEPMSKVTALQEAKCWLRDYSSDNRTHPFRHPAYWSAFVLIGDAD